MMGPQSMSSGPAPYKLAEGGAITGRLRGETTAGQSWSVEGCGGGGNYRCIPRRKEAGARAGSVRATAAPRRIWFARPIAEQVGLCGRSLLACRRGGLRVRVSARGFLCRQAGRCQMANGRGQDTDTGGWQARRASVDGEAENDMIGRLRDGWRLNRGPCGGNATGIWKRRMNTDHPFIGWSTPWDSCCVGFLWKMMLYS
mmetsp:Transcript_11479/g.27877  ORF Transcript_11479/g.27877 Transcript_11479/m.27877 type:complete len:200 (+) Transcript_11479:731-1330(+)